MVSRRFDASLFVCACAQAFDWRFIWSALALLLSVFSCLVFIILLRRTAVVPVPYVPGQVFALLP